MSTGSEGGMVTTNSRELWLRAWAFKDHGKTFNAVHLRDHAPGLRRMHESIGTKWRLTEMQSALGRILVRKLDRRVEKRLPLCENGEPRFRENRTIATCDSFLGGTSFLLQVVGVRSTGKVGRGMEP